MRIITPTGKLYEMFRVEPYAERMDTFNGKVQRVTAVATDMSVRPTGVRCYVKTNKEYETPYFYVGNLSTEKVQEILESIMKYDYYDFSKLEYQKLRDGFIFNCKIDGGTSLPYYFENLIEDLFSPALPYESPLGWDCDEDTDEDEDEEV